MRKLLPIAVALLLLPVGALAAETPPHSIAVQGAVEIYLPPDYAEIELGVVSQAPVVADALADNSARMSQVIAAIKSLGISDADIQTSKFDIAPKYAPRPSNDYDSEEFRTVVGYYISNKVTVRIHALANVAKIIDDGVKAGANSSGTVTFRIKDLSTHLDDARRRAMENAYHKAEVLASAAHAKIGPAISITDNQADLSYDNTPRGTGVETVVVTGSRVPTPIEPGLVKIEAAVTVVYALR